MVEGLRSIMVNFKDMVYFKNLEIKEHKIHLSRSNEYFTNRKDVIIKFLIPYQVDDNFYSYIENEFEKIKNSNYGIKVYTTIDKQNFWGDRIIIITFEFNTKIDFGNSGRVIEELKSLFKLHNLDKIEKTEYIKKNILGGKI